MNYKIKPSAAKEIFTLEDENGNTVADVRGRELAEKFAALPQIVAILNEIVDNGGMTNEKTLKLFLERNNLITQ